MVTIVSCFNVFKLQQATLLSFSAARWHLQGRLHLHTQQQQPITWWDQHWDAVNSNPSGDGTDSACIILFPIKEISCQSCWTRYYQHLLQQPYGYCFHQRLNKSNGLSANWQVVHPCVKYKQTAAIWSPWQQVHSSFPSVTKHSFLWPVGCESTVLMLNHGKIQKSILCISSSG